MTCTSNTIVSKKPHWFDSYQENLIKNIEIEKIQEEETKKKERKELKREKRALKILNKLPEDLVNLCLEFLDENFKRKHYLTKVTNLFKKYVGSLANLDSDNYEDYPIYKLLKNIQRNVLVRFIRTGTPSKYYNKIFNDTLFNNYKVTKPLYKTLIERYEGHNNLHNHTCAWEITKLVRFAFKEIIIEGENLYNTDMKKYKEYNLHFKKYERYAVHMVNSIVCLHKTHKNTQK
jgi:hypothetical protein